MSQAPSTARSRLSTRAAQGTELVRLALKDPQRALFAVSPKLHRAAVTRGLIVERKWSALPGERFDTYIDDQHPDRDWFVQWIQQSGADSVLEVGGGGLHEARKLRDLGALERLDYTVADIAKEFIEQGRQRLPEVTFVQGSINKLPFGDGSFDVVYSRAVIEHQPYYEKPLRELFRVARGTVVVNLFRWATHEDVLQHGKYYSNSYEIGRLVAFVKTLSSELEHVLVLAGEEEGQNQYDDQRIRRTGDHLVLIGQKVGRSDSESAYRVLDELGIRYTRQPYA